MTPLNVVTRFAERRPLISPLLSRRFDARPAAFFRVHEFLTNFLRPCLPDADSPALPAVALFLGNPVSLAARPAVGVLFQGCAGPTRTSRNSRVYSRPLLRPSASRLAPARKIVFGTVVRIPGSRSRSVANNDVFACDFNQKSRIRTAVVGARGKLNTRDARAR